MGAIASYEWVQHRLLLLRGVVSRHVPTSVGRLHVYDAPGFGALPSVVLLHGIAANAVSFQGLIAALRPHVRRIIVPDAPGHGMSEVPSGALDPDRLFVGVDELLTRELDEPALVFGNSMGGGAAMRYGLARPEKVRGLFLSSPAGAWMEASELSAFLTNFRMQERQKGREFLSKLYARPPLYTPLIAEEVRMMFLKPFLASFIDAIRPEHQLRPEELSRLAMPLHLSWGKSERLMPRSHLSYFRAHLPPHAEIDEPEGFGHCPHLESPRDLAERVLAFLRRTHSSAALASS